MRQNNSAAAGGRGLLTKRQAPKKRRRSNTQTIRRYDWLLAPLAGGAFALGHAPFFFFWIAPIAISVLTWVLAGTTIRRGFGLGWLAGAAYFAVALNWIVEPFLVYPERHGWMAPFALVLMAGGLALFWGAAGALTRLAGGVGIKAHAAFAGAFTLAEIGRATLLTGFPWAMPAYIWADTPVFQMLAFIGPYGLTFATLLILGLPGAIRPRLLTAGFVVVSVAAIWFAGVARVPDSPPFTRVVLRLVQPNAPQDQKWDPAHQQTFFDRQIEYTRGAAGADLIIWPEVAVPYPIDERPEFNAFVAEAAGPDTKVALGAIRMGETDDGVRYYNSMAVIGEGGEIEQIYDKAHLVPFGEYLPFPGVWESFGLRAIAQNAGRYASGPGPVSITVDGIPPFQPLICYEAIFPGEILRGADRPGWLLQITNDAWFGDFAGPEQHLSQARARSIEHGLPMVRVANTGISAVIDAYGSPVANLSLGEEGALDSLLPDAIEPTPYAEIGDAPWYVVPALLWLGAALFGRREPLS